MPDETSELARILAGDYRNALDPGPEPRKSLRNPLFDTAGFKPDVSADERPPERQSPQLPSKSQLVDILARLYGRAIEPLPTDPDARFKARFGVDRNLPWNEFHNQAMQNFMGKVRNSVPGVRSATQAYNAFVDPEHPITQKNQSTKDAAILAGLAAFEVGAPWIANKLGRPMATAPELSKHPNQRGENLSFSAPGLLAGWYGIRPTKP